MINADDVENGNFSHQDVCDLIAKVESLQNAWVDVNHYPFQSIGYQSARSVFEPGYKNP